MRCWRSWAPACCQPGVLQAGGPAWTWPPAWPGCSLRLAREEEPPPPAPPWLLPTGCQARLDLYRGVQEDEGSDEASLCGALAQPRLSPQTSLPASVLGAECQTVGVGGGPWEPAEASSPTSGASERRGGSPSPKPSPSLSCVESCLVGLGTWPLPIP